MSEKLRCGYCRKMVRDKPIFGTLHVCRSAGERTEVDYYRWMAAEQKRMNAEWERQAKLCEGA
jgi:hypothetical protein